MICDCGQTFDDARTWMGHARWCEPWKQRARVEAAQHLADLCMRYKGHLPPSFERTTPYVVDLMLESRAMHEAREKFGVVLP